MCAAGLQEQQPLLLVFRIELDQQRRGAAFLPRSEEGYAVSCLGLRTVKRRLDGKRISCSLLRKERIGKVRHGDAPGEMIRALAGKRNRLNRWIFRCSALRQQAVVLATLAAAWGEPGIRVSGKCRRDQREAEGNRKENGDAALHASLSVAQAQPLSLWVEHAGSLRGSRLGLEALFLLGGQGALGFSRA